MHSFYREAHLVLNLSHPEKWVESFGMTLLEAMSYGLPVIAPPVGGPAELVQDGVNGYKIDLRKLGEVAGRINEMFLSPAIYQKFVDERHYIFPAILGKALRAGDSCPASLKIVITQFYHKNLTMKKSIILTVMLGIAFFNTQAITLFVKQGGNGNGTFWEDAIGDLNAALTVAEPGDQIWIAKGTYVPTLAADRKATFFIPSGVKVYGGFAGNETSLEQRNILSNNTVLSGNIGSKTASSDNVFSVIYMKNVDKNTC